MSDKNVRTQITERVVDFDSTTTMYSFEELAQLLIALDYQGMLKEPIVRCKDCATEMVYPDGQVDHECPLIGTWADSEWNPDGFCAWARRKEKC